MQPRYRVSRAAIDLIKRFEGYRPKAAVLPDGRWTIGHGHTLTAREGAQVSPDDAEALLLYDLIGVAHGLNESVYSPLTQNQFDALASFVFSIGLDRFQRSDVLRRLNEGNLIQAACALELWRKAEVGGGVIVVDALVRRRAVEKTLFLTPLDGAWVAAPSQVLKALLDNDAQELVPREPPAVVTASLDGDQIVVTREDAPAEIFAPPEDEAASPALAAAEAITARLQTIFPETDDTPAVAPAVHPEHIPAEPHPQADFAPPIDLNPSLGAQPEAAADEPAPFRLEAPAEREDGDDDVLVGVDEFITSSDDELAGPDLFDAQPSANDPEDDLAFLSRLPEADAGFGETEADPDPEFVAPAVQPLPQAPRRGLLTLLVSAVLGLAFFGGGVFWATNARPVTPAMWLDPRVVGWLAGIAGVGFFVVAAFLLLERLGSASEHAARHRP